MTATAIPFNPVDRERFQTEVLDHICFMLVAARGCVEEPHLYGPLRLIDSVSRLVELLERYGLATDFMQELRRHIDAHKFILMSDADAFVRSIDDAVMMSARHEVEDQAAR